MKFLVVLCSVVAVAMGKPGALIGAPVAYVQAGAPIGVDGRVVDTPEVAQAKAEHAAAHINERINLANEAVKSASADHVVAYSAPVAVHAGLPLARVALGGAPIGLDGRVVDTPEVALAKAEHAAAHINEKFGLSQESLRSAYYSSPLLVNAYTSPFIQSYVY